MRNRHIRTTTLVAMLVLSLVAAPLGGAAGTSAEVTQSDDLSQVVQSVNENEIENANDALTSFNDQLQQKAGLLNVDVENVSPVETVSAATPSEAQSEAERLRTAADDREAAIFDRVVTVINEGGVAEVDPTEVQSPADAREVADRLEQQGGLATQAAQSLRDAADLVENDLKPPLNAAADQLSALEGDDSDPEPEPAVGTVEGTVTDADGSAVADATVSVGDQQTTTADDGSYSLELEPGEYAVTVSAEGYEEASDAATVEADATSCVDVTLTETDDGDSGTGDDGSDSDDSSEMISAIWNAVVDFGLELANIFGIASS